jgi:LuxR family maltose regulon positive regulatory protein
MLALLYGWIGQFARGEALLEIAHELLPRPEVSAVSLTKYAQAESMLYMLSGEGQRCMDAARRGLEIIAHSGVRLWSDTFLLNSLYGALADDDLKNAADFLQQIEGRPRVERRLDRLMYAYGLAWYAALQGDAFIAHQQLKLALRTATEFGLPFLEGVAGIALSQVLFDSGDQRRAQAEALRAVALAAKIRNRMLEFMTLLAQARMSFKLGQESEGLNYLRAGLEIGRERGFMHYLWWHPQHVAYLCERALAAGIETEYVRRLILRRNLTPAAPLYSLASWPWRYRLTLFGRFDLRISEKEAPTAAKAAGRPVDLLQVLAAFGGERVKLERIADALWPHVDSDYALRSLNTTLHRLRKLLDDDSAVLLQAGELSLNRRYFWLDTWAFEQSADEAAALTKERTDVTYHTELLRLTKQALTHYRAPLLADLGDEAWAVAPRKRYSFRLDRLLSSTVSALQGAGERDAAIELDRLALESEPLSEAITRRLMQSLKDAGRSAEAEEVHRRLRSLLQPEAET